jgi:glutamate carboxypeptidase
MVFECGGTNGEVAAGRKGKTGYLLNVQGQAGHAAFSTATKASAIPELSHKIIAVERLNDPARQLVVNVGTVTGGIGPNTVAEYASAQIDSRYLTIEEGHRCRTAIERITEECTIPGTQATCAVTSSRQPMEQSLVNMKLYEYIRQEAAALKMPLLAEIRGGVSDANTIAAAGIPVIDGLGPIGEFDHSSKEYMVSESLPQRTLLAAAAIASCWRLHCRGELHIF